MCLRICNRSEKTEVSGAEIRGRLRALDLDPESFTPSSCLITVNLGSTDEDAEKMREAIAEISSTPGLFSPESKSATGITDQLPELRYELHLEECYHLATEEVPISEAVGRISLGIKSPCPPGCIVLDIGQLIEP